MKFLLFIISLIAIESTAQRVKPTAPLVLNPEAIKAFGGTDTTTKVVFIRPNNFVNALMNCAVHVNDQKLVAMKNHAYYSFPIKPNTYLLSWKGKKKRSISIEVKNGETHYVVFEMTGNVNIAAYGAVSVDFTPRLADKDEANKLLESAKPIN